MPVNPNDKIKQVNQDEIQEKKKTLIVNIYKLNGARAQVHVVLALEGVDARDSVGLCGVYIYPRKPKRLCRSSSLGRRLNSSCDRGVTQRSVWKTLSPTCTMPAHKVWIKDNSWIIASFPYIKCIFNYRAMGLLLVLKFSPQAYCISLPSNLEHPSWELLPPLDSPSASAGP